MKRNDVNLVLCSSALLLGGFLAGCNKPANGMQIDFAPDVGLACASIGLELGTSGSIPDPVVIPTPGPIVPVDPIDTTHPRNECPTGGWVTHGDGHRTRCPDCEPAWGDEPELTAVPTAPTTPPMAFGLSADETGAACVDGSCTTLQGVSAACSDGSCSTGLILDWDRGDGRTMLGRPLAEDGLPPIAPVRRIIRGIRESRAICEDGLPRIAPVRRLIRGFRTRLSGCR